jgi:hypothetical protein
VAPGYFADIVAVEGDPLADIRVVIDKVRWVMKGGQVVVDKGTGNPKRGTGTESLSPKTSPFAARYRTAP